MYTLPQQAFAFSEMVGSEDLGKGTAAQLEQALAGKVDSYLASSDLVTLIGTWSRVWGPGIWQAPRSDGADNAMVVVHSPDPSTYLVTIAGTNPVSTYDIKVEDLEVDPTTSGSTGAAPRSTSQPVRTPASRSSSTTWSTRRRRPASMTSSARRRTGPAHN